MVDFTAYYAEEAAKFNAVTDAISDLPVGAGVTVRVYTDCHAYTIIKKTAKTMTLRQDKATRDPNWKPEFIPGGFAGHCTNQHEQTYTYEENPDGAEIKISLRTWTDYTGHTRRAWKQSGCGTHNIGGSVSAGRREYYDYNF